MAQRNSGYDRKPRDCYETPEWVSKVILPFIPNTAEVWEPACASGKMSIAVNATYSSDLVTDYGTSGVNFLEQTLDFAPYATAIVTNPPFNREAEKFIRHSLKLMGPVPHGFVAMLLPVDFDSAKTRRDIFAENPYFSTKIVLTSRIVWFRDPEKKNNPSSNHAWFVWRMDKRPSDLPNIVYHFKDE